MVPKFIAAVLSLAVACPLAAAPALTADVIISTTPKRSGGSIFKHLGFNKKLGRHGQPSVGVGIGLEEGKPLEMMIWGGGGAIIGSFAGPLGAIAGGASGALVGLLISIFVVPHNGPQPKNAEGHPSTKPTP